MSVRRAQRACTYAKGFGPVDIDWDGLSWARRPARTRAWGRAARCGAGAWRAAMSSTWWPIWPGHAQLAQVPEAQSALVALDPNDGSVVALVGGFDYFTNKFNRVTQARRQPGSGFKPFLYSAALEHGFTPASRFLMDAPIVLDDSGAGENLAAGEC